MFEDLQKLFRESLAAFRAEIGKREPVDEIAELLSSMRRELAAARAELPELEAEMERTRMELLRERSELDQCERRGKMAERIGDTETVAVAAEWATRHRERVHVLEQRQAATAAEQELRTKEVAEMQRRYRTAEINRFRMVEELMRERARLRREELDRQTGNAFDDFSRMEERIHDGQAVNDALRELDGSDPPPAAAPASDVEDRLRELKRRMGQ
jgi:phage shock protein A